MEASKTKESQGAAADDEIQPRPAAASPPALPWTVRLQVLALVTATDLSQRRDGTVNRFLFSLGDRQTPARARPDALGVRSADVTVDASRNLWARVYSRSSSGSSAVPVPVVVYFHGGGFAFLSAASTPLDGMCRRLCRELGAVVVSVNYRLAPEHKFPAAYDDGVDALRFLDAHDGTIPGLTSMAVDLGSCFLAGESAGGNIVHHVANIWASQHQRTSRHVRLAGIFPVQPYFGGEERTPSEVRLEGIAPVVNLRRSDWSWKAFLPAGATRDHPAAHVTDDNAGLAEEGFPPVMVVVGGFDPLQDWQRRYADVLRRKGKRVTVAEYPDGFHGFYGFPELDDAWKVLEDMKAFVESNRAVAPPAKLPDAER